MFIFIFSILSIFIIDLFILVSFDVKKVIAFSTVSQISLIVFSLLNDLYLISLLHIIIHFVFKSLLIHDQLNNQALFIN